LLEGLRVECVEDAFKGVMRGDSVGQFDKGFQPVDSIVSKGFDALPVVGVGDDGADGDGDDIEQEMLATVDVAWGSESSEVMSQAKSFEIHPP
jgi:hypothetical protein